MRFLALLLAFAVLAGCMGKEEPVSGASTSGGAVQPDVIVDPTSMLDPSAPAGAAGEVLAPLWNVGDAWSMRTADGESAFLVVTQAGPDSYTIGTTSDQMASYDAMFDVSYLGKMRARDLAGAQGDQAIQYFDFPLKDGKTWTTTWDGFEVALAATKTARGFDIVGTRDGEPYVTYDFVPELKWWSKLQFAEGYGITIDKLQSAWSGEIATATAETIFESTVGAPVGDPGSGTFTVGEGQSLVVLTTHGGGMIWARALRLFDPSGQPYTTTASDFMLSDVNNQPSYTEQETLPPTPGQWTVVGASVHDPSGWGIVMVRQAAVTKTAFSP